MREGGGGGGGGQPQSPPRPTRACRPCSRRDGEGETDGEREEGRICKEKLELSEGTVTPKRGGGELGNLKNLTLNYGLFFYS